MKVLILNLHWQDSLGGAEIQCDILAEGLHKKGHKVLYLTPSGAVGREYSCTYDVKAVKDDVGEIVSAIEGYNPDVIYWRAYKNNFLRIVKHLNRKYPIVYAVSAVHDFDWRTGLKISDLAKPRHFLRVLKRSAITRKQVRGYRYVAGLTTLNQEYLPMLPNMLKYYIPNSMRCDIEGFEWPNPYVAWVANLKETKRPELFVKLAEELSELDIDFLMVGRFHPEYPDLEWITDKKKTPSNFFYLGEIPPTKVNGLLKSSICHIHTCKPEGFGNVFIQAWMMGKTSVSLYFDPGGFLTKNKIGLFAAGDWSSFLTQVRNVVRDGELRRRLESNAEQFALQKFSTERMVNQIEDLLKQFI